ncbi:MAG: hypothetical protein FJ395_02360 [Verrucomicrobia bacterium]|nr:hypothetical protein [Verrucomicrobiota bacterium]
MKTIHILTIIAGLVWGAAALAAERETSPATAEAGPTEAEMREAVQRHLDNLNAQMRPPPAPPSSTPAPSVPPAYIYSPYWRHGYGGYGYFPRPGKDSQYEDWTEVAKRAAAHARVEITSFKKLRCSPAPEQGGFSGEYVAELRLAGNHPMAREILATSGQRVQGFFYRGDKGWIFGEPKPGTK